MVEPGVSFDSDGDGVEVAVDAGCCVDSARDGCVKAINSDAPSADKPTAFANTGGENCGLIALKPVTALYATIVERPQALPLQLSQPLQAFAVAV
jgi:hypothetical protein